MYACDKSYNQKSVDRNACYTHAYVVENDVYHSKISVVLVSVEYIPKFQKMSNTSKFAIKLVQMRATCL